ncbi:MAG: UPF0755 protein [Phenylobacterium sp.]|jgi:UPF0755 protein
MTFKPIKWLISSVLTALILLLLVLCGYVFVIFPGQTIELQHQRLIEVAQGKGFNQLCRQLVREEVIGVCGPMKWYSKFNPELRLIKAGSYLVEPGLTHQRLLELFSQGKEHQFSLTFVEGERLRDLLAKLAAAPNLNDDIGDLTDLAQRLNSEHPHLEGLLFPDTYHYASGSSSLAVITRAYQRMQTLLAQEWANRAVGLPYQTPYEALIMASIIEKETAVASERELIASVFINRLNKRMRLQTDPTVIYGLGENFDGNITRAHLKQKTAYNTYRINGLPPTPIAMPGIGAIHAALNPADTQYYYFVANKNHSHQFSKTLKEHNRAVRKYQLGLAN